MRALLLAAGRGERMRPLSDDTPKPLLLAGGRTLIDWQLDRLVAAGLSDIVINLAHHAETIEAAVGDGTRFGARIRYSHEGASAEAALETLGGVVHALPLLATGDAPFVVVASDLFTAFDYGRLTAHAQAIALGAADAHLVLVDNPPYHAGGDMGLDERHRVTLHPPLLTYAGIGVFSPRLFAGESAARKPLFPWMYRFVERGRVTGEHFTGTWHNLGTPDDLAALDAALARTGHTAP
jgi:MurNAc alpha-1-phosphate uridylyltransferase